MGKQTKVQDLVPQAFASEDLPEVLQDTGVKTPPPLSKQVASAWMRTPANDPSEGYDLLVSATFGKDWITLKAGEFQIDALCSISSATIDFGFSNCVPILVEDDDDRSDSAITIKAHRSEKTKTTFAAGLDSNLVAQGSAKIEKTADAGTTAERQVFPERPFHRNGPTSIQLGSLGQELCGPAMVDWRAFRVIPEKGRVSTVAAFLRVKQRSINFHEIRPVSAPARWIEPLRQLLSTEESKRKRAFEILLAHLAQSALANYQDGLSATIAYHKLVFRPNTPHLLTVDQQPDRNAIEIDGAALELYLTVDKGREASALIGLGVDPKDVEDIDASLSRTASRGDYFVPESTPPHSLQILKQILEKGSVRSTELMYPNALKDLRGLKLVISDRGTDEVRLVDASITNADYLLRLAVAKAECIVIARTILKLNPLASGMEIAAAVSQDLKLGWNVEGTLRRNGNAILRWMLWLEPYVVDAARSNKASLIAYAVDNKVVKGRPDAYRKAMEKELRRLVEEGITSSEIAEKFGVSIGTVAGWKRHYNLSRPRRRRKD